MTEELTPYVVKGEIVAEDAWRLIYWRYHQRYEEGYSTLDEALGASWGMLDTQSGAAELIIRPDGSRLEGDDFEQACREWEKAHGVL